MCSQVLGCCICSSRISCYSCWRTRYSRSQRLISRSMLVTRDHRVFFRERIFSSKNVGIREGGLFRQCRYPSSLPFFSLFLSFSKLLVWEFSFLTLLFLRVLLLDIVVFTSFTSQSGCFYEFFFSTWLYFTSCTSRPYCFYKLYFSIWLF